MTTATKKRLIRWIVAAAGVLPMISAPWVLGANREPVGAGDSPPPAVTNESDHRMMLDNLKINSLRRGSDGDLKSPNSADTGKSKDTPHPKGTVIETVSPLKDAFKNKFLIGTTLTIDALQNKAPDEVALVQRHFNAITAENSMKPYAVQPRENEFMFAQADKLVEIAEKSGATVVGHTLVWHEQTPNWFFKGPDGKPADRALALARMRKHIATVVGRYKGRIKQWDVVNEAISDGGDSDLRQTPWRTAIGDDFIEQAFRAAHEADPKAVLIYNDYNIEQEYKRPKALRMLKSLLAKGVPVHAVGIQCHWRLDNPDFSKVEESIKQFSALGLKVMITELDIGVLPGKYQGADISAREAMTPEQAAVINPYTSGLPDAVAQQHGERYRQAFEMFLRHQKHIGRVTLWGSRDNASWRNNFPVRGRTDYPLLFDREAKPKPAFYAVAKAATTAEKP